MLPSCRGGVVTNRGDAIRLDVLGAVIEEVVQDHSERLATCRPECAVVVNARSWMNVIDIVRVPGSIRRNAEPTALGGRDGVDGAGPPRGVWSDCE